MGWTLRSGGADGADTAFEDGWWDNRSDRDATYTANDYECFIPWAGFNGHELSSHDGCNIVPNGALLARAEGIASKIHPAWDRLKQGAKKLHTRNIYQVLGPHLNNPSSFLICYAEVDKQGTPKGGTRTAWVCAKENGVECFNLYFEGDRNRLLRWID